MSIHEARLIREIKKGCTYRRLAEIFYTDSDPAHGVQGYGEDLCKEALLVLYPERDVWREGQDAFSIEFKRENKSNYYWWE